MTGSAIRPKNSCLVAPPGFMLCEAADLSGLDVTIFIMIWIHMIDLNLLFHCGYDS